MQRHACCNSLRWYIFVGQHKSKHQDFSNVKISSACLNHRSCFRQRPKNTFKEILTSEWWNQKLVSRFRPTTIYHPCSTCAHIICRQSVTMFLLRNSFCLCLKDEAQGLEIGRWLKKTTMKSSRNYRTIFLYLVRPIYQSMNTAAHTRDTKVQSTSSRGVCSTRGRVSREVQTPSLVAHKSPLMS